MHRLTSFATLFLALSFVMVACATQNSKIGVTFPTFDRIEIPVPWATIPMVISIANETARPVKNMQDLKSPPKWSNKDGALATGYIPVPALGFAIWIPPDCKLSASGTHVGIRPDYSENTRKNIRQAGQASSRESQGKKAGTGTVDTTATNALLESKALLYTCDGTVTATIGPESKVNKFSVAELVFQKVNEIFGRQTTKEAGEDHLIIPIRGIMITAVRRAVFPKELTPSPPNLLLWSQRLDQAFDVDAIYGDKTKGFLYMSYRWSLDNLEIDRRKDQSVVVDGLRAYFGSDDYFYLLDISALEGRSTGEQLGLMLRVVDSFQFVKAGK